MIELEPHELDVLADIESGAIRERDRVLSLIAEARRDWSHCSARWVLDRIEEKVKDG